jgi:hypothetical protein
MAGLVVGPAWQTLGASRPVRDDWDLRWLSELNGVHKQVFDFGKLDTGLLHVVRNWLNAHNEVYGLADDRLDAIVGLASKGFPANAADPLWEKYPIGERYQIKDPATGTWAKRNVMVHVPDDPELQSYSIPTMVRRGVIFWMCNNALHGVARKMAGPGGDAAAIYADFRANMLPHVKVVPAHTMLLGLCQERGCTYQCEP